MKIHEHQAKSLFDLYHIPVPRGGVVHSVKEAVTLAKGIKSNGWVVKAQIHAGGRGKAGGVQLAGDLNAVERHAENLLESRLVTPQTGPKGSLVHSLLIEESCSIASEHYVSFLVDRSSQRIACIACAEGGGDIEEIAATRPESIHREFLDPAFGLQPFQARRIAYALGVPAAQMRTTTKVLHQLYELFAGKDCSLLEVNPLVVTRQDEIWALDGKMILDESALFRHPDVLGMRDSNEEDERERKAREQDLSYVALEGSIGCMVNGAGLAMATMDILHHFGGEPANFLDVGGGATTERIAAAFEILMMDQRVQAVFINIFGGIVRCDILAEGIIQAAAKVSRLCPLIVRLEGTRVKEGLAILQATQLPIVTATSMDEGAKLAVQAAKGSRTPDGTKRGNKA